MEFQILSLFPERYTSYVESGLPARAYKQGMFRLHLVQLRDFADPGRKGRVDDNPYGGGPGMVVQVGPVDRALQAMPQKYPVVLFTPRGERLTQKTVRRFAALPGLTLVPGYYEGVDERVADHLVDHQISLGDFVLGSGDLAALCLIEATTRLLPGYMGSAESAVEESHDMHSEEEKLEYPQYTRPAEYRGWSVPTILLEGHHQKIADWRRSESRRITSMRKDSDVERSIG